MKRRELLKSLAVASVISVTAPRVWATSQAEDVKEVEYLFVQNTNQVSLKDGVLTLKGVAQETLYFSDRPERIVGRVTTQEFVDTWADGHESFKADPPNAILSILRKPEAQDIALVLKNPRIKGDDLIYDVDVLDGIAMVSGEVSSLFIDTIGHPLTPLSFAGAARRSSRRSRR
jgi:hypothetical protein